MNNYTICYSHIKNNWALTKKPFVQSEKKPASVSPHLYIVDIYTTHTLAFPLMQSFCLLVLQTYLEAKSVNDCQNSTTKA